jgi:hypothetical protein
MKDLKPTKLCHNCFKPHQNMGIYCVQCDKFIKTMTITKEQFDLLKVNDKLKNENFTLSVETKFANSMIGLTNKGNAYIYSLNELQEANYSINQPIRHNCGFPYGDYSDKEVIVKVSNSSIKDCEKMMHYTRLISVSEDGFKDCIGSTWKYAVLVANNVDIIVKL